MTILERKRQKNSGCRVVRETGTHHSSFLGLILRLHSCCWILISVYLHGMVLSDFLACGGSDDNSLHVHW